MRYGVIVNPTSGKNTGAQIGLDAVGRLRAAGAQIVDLSALDAAGALARGRAAIAKGEIDTLVVAGGDGMVHLGTNLCAGTAVPLGIIAAGTGNDIARETWGSPCGTRPSRLNASWPGARVRSMRCGTSDPRVSRPGLSE